MYRYNSSSKVASPPLVATRLLDQVRERIRDLHYRLKTEKAYLYWARFYVLWSARQGGTRHPKDPGSAEVKAFLTMLANERQVSPATRRQALNALLFLYRQVLSLDLPRMHEIGRPPERKRISVVLTVAGIQLVFAHLRGVESILARLLYGAGLRLAEGLSVRVKDLAFDRHVSIVRSGKGDKDRVVMLPRSLVPPLRQQLQELLGHSDVSTTMIYAHVLDVAAGGTTSPLDALTAAPPFRAQQCQAAAGAYASACA